MSDFSSPQFPGRIIFHIGDNKAASTSIQMAFAANAVKLRSGGQIAYPFPKKGFGHNFAASGFNRTPFRKIFPDTKALFEVAQAARKKSPELTVISAEGFEDAIPSRFALAQRKLFPVPDPDVFVFCLVRPHLSRLTAALAEYIKCGWASADPMQDVRKLERHWMGYYHRLTRWRKAYQNQFRASPFIRGTLTNDDPLSELFFKTIGLDQVEIEARPIANASTSVENLMRIHYVMRSFQHLSRHERHTIGWWLTRRLSEDELATGSTVLQFGSNFTNRFVNRHIPDARRIDEAFFGSQNLFVHALKEAAAADGLQSINLLPEACLESHEIARMNDYTKLVEKITTQPDWRRRLRRQEIAAQLGS